MDAWADSTQATSLILGTLLNYTDPLLAPILAIKKSLLALPQHPDDSDSDANTSPAALFLAVCDGDLVSFETLARANSLAVTSYFPSDDHGVTCLILAVVLDQYPVAESLLANHRTDPDAYDTAGPHYTPLMWAVHFSNLEMVKLLLDYQADPYLAPKDDDRNCVLMVTPSSAAIYEFFRSHNLFKVAASADQDLYLPTSFGGEDESVDDVAFRIRMQTLGNSMSSDSLEEAQLDEEAELACDTELVQTPDYDFDKLLPEQFIKFTDSDIPSLLDFIFGLRSSLTTYQHATKIPAAALFQLIRYSHFKVDSRDLTEFLFECFVTRLRSVTNTKSGVFNMALMNADLGDKSGAAAAGGAGDIVLLSYWLSVIQFLHFYFVRSNIYTKYPKFLQELINLTQSLVATLSFSINSRLNLLVDDCLINFTNLVDVSSVLYAKDWNLFKGKNKQHPSSYDDILHMLYPPSELELMKPSPIRYVQVLGALDYVLKLHAVDPLLRFQTFSQVFYYINAVIFNRLISTSKYCSRAKAIQIRLNISALEDWLRSHNHRIYKPERVGCLSALLGENKIELKNLLEENTDVNDPHSLSFYYKSLYHIGKGQLQPTIELLQWLQVMSGITDEESLINTINQFDSLNYFQLFKLTNKLYRYEVEEKKIPKPLTQYLKRLMGEQGEKQIANNHLHYMTQTNFLLKEEYIYLNPNYVFAVALPNFNELIVNYGSGIGGVKVMRAKKYQPSLPISVMDDLEEILSANRNAHVNDTYDYDNQASEESDEDEESNNELGTPKEDETRNDGVQRAEEKAKTFKGDELFKQMQPPASLAHKNWGGDDIDSNPW